MALHALIFDVDGTLADTQRDAHRVAFNAAFAQVGLTGRWDEALYGELHALARLACIVPSTAFSAADNFAEALVRRTDLDHQPEEPAVRATLNDLRRWQAPAVSF